MKTKEKTTLSVERIFEGSENLEQILTEFIGYHLDTFASNMYDIERASAISSLTGGMALK